jgi:hypothetical protein
MPTLTPEQPRAAWRRQLPLWLAPAVFFLLAAFTVVFLVPPSPLYDEAGTEAQDEAAKERARQFLHALELEPGPVACRSASSGSAWCTIREGHSERFWQLFCSWRHPTCVQNHVEVNP